MAYRFEPDESVREAFARCAGEELDHAMRTLSEKLETEPADAVHAARKAIKRERALLRRCAARSRPSNAVARTSSAGRGPWPVWRSRERGDDPDPRPTL